MATRPDRTKRTRTPRNNSLRDKYHVITIRFTTLERAFRYDPETGHLFERYEIHHRKREHVKVSADHVAPPSHVEYETPFPAGRMHKDGYIVIPWRNKSYMAHKLAYFLMVGKWPSFYLRHKNGLRFDNRWCNLKRA